jgi:hypothetical protein
MYYKAKKYENKLKYYTEKKHMTGGTLAKFKVGDRVIYKNNSEIGIIKQLLNNPTTTNQNKYVVIYPNGEQLEIKESYLELEMGSQQQILSGGAITQTEKEKEKKIMEEKRRILMLREALEDKAIEEEKIAGRQYLRGLIQEYRKKQANEKEKEELLRKLVGYLRETMIEEEEYEKEKGKEQRQYWRERLMEYGKIRENEIEKEEIIEYLRKKLSGEKKELLEELIEYLKKKPLEEKEEEEKLLEELIKYLEEMMIQEEKE